MVKRGEVDRLYEWCDELVGMYGGRDEMYDRLEGLYFQERWGREGEGGGDGVQRVTLPLATNVVDLVVDLAGSRELRVRVPAAGESLRAKREAEEVERWVRGWLREGERRLGRGSYVSQMAWHAAMRGMVVVRVLPVVEGGEVSGEMPVVMQVRDPRHVYVEWGGMGVQSVVEEWERSVRSVRREYGDKLGGLKGRGDSEVVRWREYWDKRRVVYWADGEVVAVGGREVREHGYGGLPYGVVFGRSVPVWDRERMVRPLLVGVERVIENAEVLASVMATAGVQTVTSAFAVYSQRHGVGEGQVELDVRPGAVNYFDPSLGERVEAIQRPGLPGDIYQLMTLFLNQFQQGTFPAALYGEVGREMAGYAINMLTQSGRRALLPIWRAVERGHEEGIRVMMRLVREFVGPARGGKLLVVDYREGEGGRRVRQEVGLDWERLGEWFDVECRLEDPLPADRAANLRLALEAWKGGLISQETALERFGIVDDVPGEMMRIFVERVVGESIEGEARRVAEERGYLPRGGGEEDEARRLAAMGAMVGGAGGAEGGGAAAADGGIDVASLQRMAGMPAALPGMAELAGGAPGVLPAGG